MDDSKKSKIRWLAGLVIRLLGVSSAAAVLTYVLGSTYVSLIINPRIFRWLILLGLLIGYTWAIYFGFPFLPKRGRRQKMFVSARLAMVLVLVTCGCVLVAFAQLSLDYRLAKLSSPANPADEVWFVDGGFLDRDLIVLARPEGHKPEKLANLCWFPDCGFASAQWSKDGKVFVCSVNTKTVTNGPVPAVAYDFSRNHPVIPAWMTGSGFSQKPAAEWRKQAATIQTLVATHGGWDGEPMDDKVIAGKEIKPWFWQLPKL